MKPITTMIRAACVLPRRRRLPAGFRCAVAAATICCALAAEAQFVGGGPPPPQVPARELAPIDVTGVWVSVVSEDWRHRMMTPPKGDYEGLPLSPAGRARADQWDPQADIAAGDECKAYGAPSVTRLPGRMRIGWLDEHTLQLEFDAGMQTRVLHFAPPMRAPPPGAAGGPGAAGRPGAGPGPGGPGAGPSVPPAALEPPSAPAPSGPPSLQGHSVAEWQKQIQSRGFFGGPSGTAAPRPGSTGGSLAVTTANLAPGYLRKNGVPYSADTVLTEYVDRFDLPNGDPWLLLTTIVEDPINLTQRFIVSSQFKKEPDDSNWNPTPCSAL